MAAIRHSWFGTVDAAWADPELAVFVADTSSGPENTRTVATLPIARPFFAADLRLDDLCSDAGPDIDVQCVSTGGRIGRVTVHTTGDALQVSVDGSSASTWRMPSAPPGTCYTLRGLGVSHDLEPARKAWGRDFATARCGTVERKRPLHVVLDLDAEGDSGTAAKAVLTIPAMRWSADLDRMSNLGGGVHLTRFDDAEAIVVETNDMGVERRYAYRLGDRLYFIEHGEQISGVDLPCGVVTTFDVQSKGSSPIVDHQRLR